MRWLFYILMFGTEWCTKLHCFAWWRRECFQASLCMRGNTTHRTWCCCTTAFLLKGGMVAGSCLALVQHGMRPASNWPMACVGCFLHFSNGHACKLRLLSQHLHRLLCTCSTVSLTLPLPWTSLQNETTRLHPWVLSFCCLLVCYWCALACTCFSCQLQGLATKRHNWHKMYAVYAYTASTLVTTVSLKTKVILNYLYTIFKYSLDEGCFILLIK